MIRNANILEPYEIILSDSSHDHSSKIAQKLGARVVKHNLKGYGQAIMEGVKAAQGEILIIADCDATYDFSESLKLIKQVRPKTLVIGKRAQIDSGAIPFMHRYFGTPILSAFLSVLFHQRITDNNSGFRVIYKRDFERLELKTKGMEFASEMLVKSLIRRYTIREVPISYHRRVGQSKLDTWSDGWRHLRFLLAYVPLNIFFVLGVTSFGLGAVALLMSLSGQLQLSTITFYRSIAFVGSFLCYVGFTILQSSVIAKIVLKQRGLGAEERLLALFAKIPFEIVLTLCLTLLSCFSVSLGYIVYNWWVHQVVLNTNLLVFLLTGATLSFQAVVGAFLVSFLLVEVK
jgi:hypothetical protein